MDAYSHVLDKLIGSSDILQASKPDLGDNGTEFTGSSRNTVSRRTIAGREHLSRNNKCGRIWAEILEEIGQAIQKNEGFCGARSLNEFVIGKSCITWLVTL